MTRSRYLSFLKRFLAAVLTAIQGDRQIQSTACLWAGPNPRFGRYTIIQQHPQGNSVDVAAGFTSVAVVSAAVFTDTCLLYCSFSTEPQMSWKASCSGQQHRRWWTLFWQLTLGQQLRTHCLACLLNTWSRTIAPSCKHTGALHLSATRLCHVAYMCVLLVPFISHVHVCCLWHSCCMHVFAEACCGCFAMPFRALQSGHNCCEAACCGMQAG